MRISNKLISILKWYKIILLLKFQPIYIKFYVNEKFYIDFLFMKIVVNYNIKIVDEI